MYFFYISAPFGTNVLRMQLTNSNFAYHLQIPEDDWGWPKHVRSVTCINKILSKVLLFSVFLIVCSKQWIHLKLFFNDSFYYLSLFLHSCHTVNHILYTHYAVQGAVCLLCIYCTYLMHWLGGITVTLVGVINFVKKYIPHKQSQHLLGDPCTYTFNLCYFF